MKRAILLSLALMTAAGTGTAAIRDRTPPSVAFRTIDGQFFYAPTQNPLVEHRVLGTATDSVSGVRTVSVSYRPCDSLSGPCLRPGWEFVQESINQNLMFPPTTSLSCDRSHRSCSWSMTSPPSPGFYLVTASATDVAGNRSKIRAIRIVVA